MGPPNGENDQKIDAGATGNRQKVQKSRNLGGKFEEEKKVEKKRAKAHASEGPAVAGKEGFGKDMDGKWVGNGQGSSTPSLILRMGGRIVCASRHPPRPLGDWRLGGWEAGILGALKNSLLL